MYKLYDPHRLFEQHDYNVMSSFSNVVGFNSIKPIATNFWNRLKGFLGL